MNIYYNIDQVPKKKNTVLTVGTFDGVHTAHQKLLNEVRYHAIDRGGRSLVITFDPHPRLVLNPDQDFPLLTTTEEKIELIGNLGIQNLLIINFTKEFAQTTFSDFIEKIIVDKIGITEFVIGYNHQFGKNREGNKNSLLELSKKLGFSTFNIPQHIESGIAVSSSVIREALLNGELEKANIALGREYDIKGTVIEGRKIGKTIGFPTANLKIDHTKKLIPKTGVYFVSVQFDNTSYIGLMNIGKRPTISNEEEIVPEVHIINFDQDIYGKFLKVKFKERIRDEIKFDSLESLTEQIKKDKEYVLRKINN